ncbi:MAG: hypothetical protein OXI69_09685 [Acidobacteriota bacterium]|nr:hypothetical protein [Acidobacteriota bacterium]
MSAFDPDTDLKQCLLELIDDSGVSDRRLSLLATGSTEAVRHMRRGSWPRLETIVALCRVLGVRLEMVPFDQSSQPREGSPAVERRPEWSHRLREEIRQDLIEVLAHTDHPRP